MPANQEHSRKGISFGKKAVFSVILIILLWLASDVVLLFFAGLLISVGLMWLSEQISRRLGISYKWSVAVLLLILIALLALGIYLLAPDIAKQIEGLRSALTRAAEEARSMLSRYEWAQPITQFDPSVLLQGRGLLTQATGAVSAVLTFFSYILIIFFVGIYLTVEPSIYKNGFLALLKDQKQKGEKILQEAGDTLRWWLVGRLISMAVIVVLTTIGLYLLNMPLAITLGIIAGILNFVPYIGPILSAIPAILIALTVSPITVLYVIALFAGIQFIESYLLDPYVERKTVLLPPALTLTFQLLAGTLFGFLGIVLAAPLLVVAIVITKNTYLGDTPAESQ